MERHGQVNTRLYQIWENARQRCRNPKAFSYKYYGGSGISFCKEWDSFLAFKKWAEENGYNDTLTLERIDIKKSYTPNNCKWIPHFQQQANTRKTRTVIYNGEKIHVSEFARRIGRTRMEVLYLLNTGRSADDIIKWFSLEKGLRKSNKKRQFSDEQVLKMKEMANVLNLKTIAEHFKTNSSNVYRIINGLRYCHLKNQRPNNYLADKNIKI